MRDLREPALVVTASHLDAATDRTRSGNGYRHDGRYAVCLQISREHHHELVTAAVGGHERLEVIVGSGIHLEGFAHGHGGVVENAAVDVPVVAIAKVTPHGAVAA